MEWNLNARSDQWDWDIEIPKNLRVSSQENGDYLFLGYSDMVEEGSVLSGEAMIGLKLGRQTYCQEKAKTTSFDVLPETSCTPITKRSRSTYHNSHSPRCQVEGCNLDLASAKDYHRRHRICANHSKSPKVVVAGMERRFCQQCSRLHDLSEFDDRKRSCRRRLSAHNARRRRSQSEDIKFSSTHRRALMDFLTNQPVSILSPNSTHESFSNVKGEGIVIMSNGVLSDISSAFHGVTPRNVNHGGLEANSNLVVYTMEHDHSFSLEPATSWGYNGRDEPRPLSSLHMGTTSATQPGRPQP